MANNEDNTKNSEQVNNSRTRTARIRLQAKNWFLTFPQTCTSKEEASERLISHFSTLKGAIVAQEKHADGNTHLHIALFLTEKLRLRDQTYFDFICGKHGNYQTMKSPKDCIAYVTKADTQPKIIGTIPAVSKGSKSPKSDQAAQMIRSGSTLNEVEEKLPGFFLLNKRKLEEYQSWYSIKRMRLALLPFKLPILYSGEDLATKDIVEWLNMNLFIQRPFKSPQLYIFGPTNTCKTSLGMLLSQYCMVYRMPLLEDFYDSYHDQDYDLVILDEFKGQKTIQFLNLWLDGQPMSVRKKGSQGFKNKNLPMIICSNYRLDECYKDLAKISTLEARLKIIELQQKIDLDNILFSTHDSEDEPPKDPKGPQTPPLPPQSSSSF